MPLSLQLPGGFVAVGAGVALVSLASRAGYDWSGIHPPSHDPVPMIVQLPKLHWSFMSRFFEPEFYR